MPTFFRKNELTEAQKANWDNAYEKYSKIFQINALRELNYMNKEDKKNFMEMGVNPIKDFSENDVFKKIYQMSMIMGNPPGHEKSALFFRLLSGKKALKYPPPLCFSYPDYDVVESNNGREIHMLDAFDLNDLIKNKEKYVLYKSITINQATWKVLKVISSTKAELTYGNWENDGFIWKIELKNLPASESESSIICHHSPTKEKITTYESLQKECKFQSLNHFYKLKIVLDEEEFKKYEEQELSKYFKNSEVEDNQFFSKNSLIKSMIQTTLNAGKEMLEKRLSNGLPAYPTEEEIDSYAKNIEQSYLGKEYYVNNGILYKKSWILKRVLPQVLSDDFFIAE